MNKSRQKDTLKKVLKYVRRYWGFMIVAILLAVCTVMLTLYVPILVGRAIDGIVYGNMDLDFILQQLLFSVVLVVVTGILQWIMNIINNKVTYNVVRDIRDEAFKKIEILP